MPKLDHKARAKGVRPEVWICLFLLVATLAVFSPVRHYSFIDFDDMSELLINAHVNAGITADGLRWAFSTSYSANWYPLTWISHMLDFELFHADPGWHHLSNVLIHAFSSALLFALMKRMTGRLWESAFVAFVFALHPQHVESVAWVSERKDVLSAFFWFLTMWLYLDYVERPKIWRYLLIVVSFSLGLMSKQMLVTLPFALLLIDVWPLKRVRAVSTEDLPERSRRIGTLLLEKVPLVALSVAASMIAFFAQRAGGALRPMEKIPLAARIGNALVAYAAYLVKLFWPTELAVFYPHPIWWPAWEVIGSELVVAVVSAVALRMFRKWPYLAVGWFWYLGTLAPVIGLVQIGDQARADRYTYIPFVGISIMLAWGIAEAMEKWPRAKSGLAWAASAVCSVWALITFVQVQYWKDSVTVFEHAIAVTKTNYLAHGNLGVALAAMGKNTEALPHLYQAIEQNPAHAVNRNTLGAILNNMNRRAEAEVQLRESIRLDPNVAVVHANLGNVLLAEGRDQEAAGEFATAVRLDPDNADFHDGYSDALVKLGHTEEAMAQLRELIRMRPSDADAHCNLGSLLLQKGKTAEAANELNTAVQLNPNLANAHLGLGNALVAMGRVDEGIAHLWQAIHLNPNLPQAQESLENAENLKGRGAR